jgi:hypothetical protein
MEHSVKIDKQKIKDFMLWKQRGASSGFPPFAKSSVMWSRALLLTGGRF